MKKLIIKIIIIAAVALGVSPAFFSNPISYSDQYIDIDTIPEYSGSPYVEMNYNQADFSEDDMQRESFEEYSDLDSLGLSLIHISEPTRQAEISYAVFCLKKKKQKIKKKTKE